LSRLRDIALPGGLLVILGVAWFTLAEQDKP